MVELVDTQDLESCEETRAGSIPVIRTKNANCDNPIIHCIMNAKLSLFLFEAGLIPAFETKSQLMNIVQTAVSRIEV